jgi:hypothetical protein
MSSQNEELKKIFSDKNAPKVDKPLDLDLENHKPEVHGPPTVEQALMMESRTLPKDIKDKHIKSFTASMMTTD